jgi:hypothetical protein
VTTPATAQQQVPPGQQPVPTGAEAALVTTTAGLLLTAVSAAALIEALKLRFTLSQDMWTALAGSAGIAMASPPVMTGVIGAASARTSRMNLARRAQFVIAAAKRVTAAMVEARSKGDPVMAAMRDQLATERRFYQQHLDAMWARATAAGMIDMEAAVHGNILGWQARRDRRTTAACLRADGCNFDVDNPPDIGLPGIGPHAGCRCSAVAPWPGGRLLAGSGARRRR